MKQATRIGYWNVQTLYETGKLEQLTMEFRRFNLDILGISECRWTGFGEHVTTNGEKLIYSGHENHHIEGVGLLLSKQSAKALIEWKPLSSRLLLARFKSRVRKITVLQVYAPTEVSDADKKRDFYSQLAAAFVSIKKQDAVIVMGDFNAQIGDTNTGLQHVMGKHGTGHLNENGELLIDFCNNNKLLIGSSIFPHKLRHKTTWRSPNNRTENQIDHLCISRTWRSSLLDVRTFRSADVGSDHFLAIAKVRMRVMATEKNGSLNRLRFNTEALKNTQTRDSCVNYLKSHIPELDISEQDINSLWQSVKLPFLDACKTLLKHRHKKKKAWISDSTISIIENRRKMKVLRDNARTRALKTMFDSQYRSLHKDVKRSCRTDKRNWTSNLACQAEDAARKNNLRELYRLSRELTGKYGSSNRPIKDENGALITSEREQMARWFRHFSEVLNPQNSIQSSSSTPSPTQSAHSNPPSSISSSSPTLEEIECAIKQLKPGKASGGDMIPPEILKADPALSARYFLPLFDAIWRTEKLPDEWMTGILVKVPKKGDLSVCKNYRGITLISIPSKILSKVLLNRIQTHLELQIRKQQAGFRTNRSCSDHIVTLRIILEQINEWQSDIHACFIDFSTAFDSIDRSSIWISLRSRGIPEKVISIIKAHYEGFECKILHNKQLSDAIRPKSGVKQGCLLSPLLFLLVLDDVLNKALTGKRGVPWNFHEHLEELAYADDIALLSVKRSDLQTNLNQLSAAASEVGLKINVGKTEFISNCSQNETPRFTVYGEEIRSKTEFCYLGCKITPTGGTIEDIAHRINKARAAFSQLYNIWISNSISIKTKLRIFNSNVKSVLLYGCESWSLTSVLIRRLQTFVNACLRKILRIWWPRVISNQDLLNSTNEPPIELIIKRRRFGWIGHTLRKDAGEVCRAALWWNPQGARNRGRPKTSWRRMVEMDLSNLNTTWSSLKQLSHNRNDFNTFVLALRSKRS